MSGIGLTDEHIGEFVPDQRLYQVVQIGDKHFGRGKAGRHRTVGVVDQLDDATYRC